MEGKLRFLFVLILLVSTKLSAFVPQENSLTESESVVINVVKKTKKELDEAEVKKRQVKSILYQLNQKIKVASDEYKKLNHQSLKAQSRVKSTAQKIVILKKKIFLQKKELIKKLKTVYYLKGSRFVAFLLSDPTRFDKNMLILRKLVVDDKKSIEQYHMSLNELEEKKQNLNKRVVELSYLKTNIRKAEGQLEKEQKKKVSFLSKLRELEKKNISKIKNLRKNLLKDTELSKIIRVTFYEKKGQLKWPLQGEIIKSYGIYDDYDYNIRFLSKGWLLQSQESKTVSAIFRAKVKYAGKLPGYGKVVILDHNDHYYSVYAKLSEVWVDKNSDIQEGQSIGKIATISQPLYFELRHYSEPLDPTNWMAILKNEQAKSQINKNSGAANDKQIL